MMSVNTCGFELAGAQVIEKKKRLGAQHGDVVDAVIDQVRADGVVPVHREGDLELGADAIDAGDEDRLAVAARVEREQAAETAHFAQHLAPVGRGEQLRQGRLHPVAQVNIHARRGVCFWFHSAGSKPANAPPRQDEIMGRRACRNNKPHLWTTSADSAAQLVHSHRNSMSKNNCSATRTAEARTGEGRGEIARKAPGPHVVNDLAPYHRLSALRRRRILSVSQFTVILDQAQHGDLAAADQLLPLVYDELRRVAAGMMAREAPGQTLQPTASGHAAWLRLTGENKAGGWAGRTRIWLRRPRRCGGF